MEKQKKRKKIYIAAFFFILAFLLAAFDVRLKTVNYTIESEKISNNVRIALITDLHSCRYGEGQKHLIKAIEKQNPDLILFGGDICDDEIPHDNTEALLKAISNKYPCYYVTGNHEFWSDEVESILDMFRSYNVNVLQGSYQTIEVNGEKVNICGIDDPEAERYVENSGITQQLQDVQEASDNGFYTILLAHRPELNATYRQYGFDLIMCGHAHGGQWRLPGIINGLLAPNQGWFPPYAGGEFTFENSSMVVSRGLARESTRIPRIFNRPELVIVDLK
ncbi:metallophosphoesterase [Anaerotignum sp.]|uniref:metallophosphoesterase n=1 Tax=Anaerotignum sp. TaxID=2039241 RepID=UPI0028A9E4BC|nr:metallophosphoesterase [Anaerotignum sp.]